MYRHTIFRVLLLSLLLSLPFAMRGDAQSPPTASDGAASLTSAPGASSRVLDRQFVLVHTAYALAIAGDAYTTADVLGNCPHCTERNPLLGARPSRARIAGVELAEFGAVTTLDALLKHRYSHSRVWLLLPTVSASVHGAGLGVNLSNLAHLRRYHLR